MLGRQFLVLVANDDDAMRDALKFALQLDLLADPELGRAGCLILKENMPDVDGLELMHDLRAHQIYLPAILLTANATPRLRQRAAAAGFRLVLEKPILDNALLEGVLSILSPQASPDIAAST